MKILLTDLAYFYHNYGAQGIVLPFIDKLRAGMQVEIAVTISDRKFWKKDLEFATKNDFRLIYKPRLNFGSYLIPSKIKQHQNFKKTVQDYDVIIDLSGIEFIGNQPNLLKWKDALNTINTQRLAERFNKKYYKYTKSYGPIQGPIYTKIIKKYLNRLSFLLIRGEDNYLQLKKLDLNVPTYVFPDVSLVLKAESDDWADQYLRSIFNDGYNNLIGISPSVVIRNINISGASSGADHEALCSKLIDNLCSSGQQVLLIPHSIGDGNNLFDCDLALAKKIFLDLKHHKNLKLLEDTELTYRKTRAIIGKLDFYVTSRYHSLASALTMNIPVVTLSWHIKYDDLMRLYMKKYLAINCRETSVPKAFQQIMEYFADRAWFDENEIKQKQEILEKQIEQSIEMIIKDIEGR